jgi:hypothetical protein
MASNTFPACPPDPLQLLYTAGSRANDLTRALCVLQLQITTVFGAFLDPVADKLM